MCANDNAPANSIDESSVNEYNNQHTPAKVKIKEKQKLTKKQVFSSLLVCGAIFVLLVGSAYASFFQNASQLNFTFGDFAPLYTGASLLVCGIFFLAMILCRGTAYKILFAVFASLGFIGGLQNVITTLSFNGLHGDGTALPPTQLTQIFNIGMWVALAAIIVWLCVLSKKSDFGRLIVSLALVFVMVTQVSNAAIEGINYASDPSKHNHKIEALYEEDDDKISYLTTHNMFEVSTKDNIIVIVLDRFDAVYFDDFLATGSEYLDELDGFTYYSDNIAKYPRTFPGVVSMLTGAEYDFKTSQAEFLDSAYRNSGFIKDLKNNGYKINLFLPAGDGYNNATCFNNLVENTSASTGYSISSKGDLMGKVFSLSSYFWSPEVIKANNDISVSSINSIVTLDGTAPEYKLDLYSDAEYYADFCEQGVSTQSSEGTFTFLHLRGCHSPLTIDENCQRTYYENTSYPRSDTVKQTTGMFKFITEYLQQLKDKGLYDDATIIITGDHAALKSDKVPYYEPELTALLVKESGQSGTPLKTSTAQVSQDNFLATIVKSANLKTDHDYGRAYSDIQEGETVERIHYFDTKFVSVKEYFTYTITGNGRDFSNWKETKG